jgi:mannose-6-phosphate isomerase-like protein (cupin superfamily)
MDIIRLSTAFKRLKPLSDEIRHADCFKEKTFTSGLIAFRPMKRSNRKQINHNDKDVVCHVIKGTGRLNAHGKRIVLRPGIVCHIPKGTPHDFAATRNGELVLFYSLIKTDK